MTTFTEARALVAPLATGARFRQVARALRSVAARLGMLVALLLIWQLATSAIQSLYFPTPTDIAATLRTGWLSGPVRQLFLTDDGLANIVASVARVSLGWLLAIVAGVVVGMAVGLSRKLGDYVGPLLEFSRSIPPPVLIPVFLSVFGVGGGMKVVLIGFGAVWPVLLNTIDGVRSVDPMLLDAGRSFRISRWRRFSRVILPAASPRIMAGARVSLSIAIILMVVSEMVATTNGVGFAIVNAQRVFAIDDMWAAIVVLAVMGLMLNSLFVAVERRALAWHHGANRIEG